MEDEVTYHLNETERLIGLPSDQAIQRGIAHSLLAIALMMSEQRACQPAAKTPPPAVGVGPRPTPTPPPKGRRGGWVVLGGR